MQYGLFQQYELIDQFSIDMMLVGLEAQITSDEMKQQLTQEKVALEVRFKYKDKDKSRAFGFGLCHIQHYIIIATVRNVIRGIQSEHKAEPIHMNVTYNLLRKPHTIKT